MTNPWYEDDGLVIYQANVIEIDSLSPNSVDLVVTSPPYNLGKDYGGYDDDRSYVEYLEFSRRWMLRVLEWLKEDGRMCLNVPLDESRGGPRSVGADLTTLAQQVGFKYRTTIVWWEGNVSRRTAWGSWSSAASPHVIAPVELILVLYKSTWKKTSGSHQSDITRSEFVQWTNGVWQFPGEKSGRIGHPSPFPIELPRRCIKLFSFVGDLVLDPFMGSGTTLLAALMNQRRAIGIEMVPEYCQLAVDRIKSWKGGKDVH